MINKCYYCGQEITEGSSVCPSCNRDQTEYRKLVYESDFHYNTGLEKARVRDLTGAIQSLRESLRINKYNTEARNLLGLVFYARGNNVEAISEWVISKNLQPEDNRADFYLKDAQKPGEVDKANQAAKKYNRALEQCKTGNMDLAKIQLKRMTGQGSCDMDAFCLLTLIYIKEKNFNEARKLIKLAQAIDLNDTAILKYKKEIKASEKDKKNKKNKPSDLVNFNDGNDNVIMTRGAFRDFTDGSRTAVINILVGIILGVLFCYFLIIPGIKQKASSDATNSIVNANESATTSKNSASELQKKVDSLKAELDKYNAKSNTVTSYEQLLQANTAVAGGDFPTAKTLLGSVNPDLLSENAKAMYDNLNAAINADTLNSSFAAGKDAFNKRDYQGAVTQFQSVVALQQDFQNGEAMYRLAESFDKLEQYDDAITYYNKVSEILPDSPIAGKAAARSATAQKKKDAAAQQ